MFDKQKVLNKLKDYSPYINGYEYMKRASVLIPIVRKEGESHILFEVRSAKLKHRPCEISFPGGGIEENETAVNAAIRETCEEIGVSGNDIEIIGSLDLLVTPVNYIIHPFAGYLNNASSLRLNSDEVDHVFTVPLKVLLEMKPEEYKNTVNVEPDNNLPFDIIPGKRNYRFEKGTSPVFFYRYNGYVIWGITAKILYNFLEFFR
ncbi:CoA pyrophosphatase [Peptacetobacter hominis]|uniref:CoA pyrophosphatase n=1 Tax=Peptacetobacter hominis TaxID=2743610 RepID=A0A544QVS5_9FIRM|nr:CoA pyrophosphatase [Peptacetobacter hominis]TQQ84798.1 CoA pyrophosphatase [Peptacetobacter hominis]